MTIYSKGRYSFFRRFFLRRRRRIVRFLSTCPPAFGAESGGLPFQAHSRCARREFPQECSSISLVGHHRASLEQESKCLWDKNLTKQEREVSSRWLSFQL